MIVKPKRGRLPMLPAGRVTASGDGRTQALMSTIDGSAGRVPAKQPAPISGRKGRRGFAASRPLLALVYGAGDAPDPLLAAFADRLLQGGTRVAGLVQRSPAAAPSSRCNMVVEILPSGRRVAISEDRGAGARGCRLDAGLLTEALAGAEAMLEGGADLLILNRFGKVEAEGGGGRALLARAVELGVPAVVAVPWRNIGAFRAFAGDLAEEIGPEAFALRAGELIACGPGMPSAFLR